MNFKKISITSLVALAAVSCFAADYAADVKAALEESRAMEFDKGNDHKTSGLKFAARNKVFELGAKAMAEKNVKDRADFSKAVCDALKASKDKEEQIYLLYVLQFTGGEESLKTIEGFLSNKDNDIADAARMALQKNSSPKATEVLGNAYKSQKDMVRRSAIINAISARGSSVKVPANEKLLVSASYIAKHSWPEIDYSKFRQEFEAAPTLANVKKAIDKGCDRALVLVAPYVFSKTASAQFDSFKKRFDSSEAPTKAWVLTNLTGVEGAKKFIIEAGLNGENDVKKAAVWALSVYPDAEAVNAILQMQQSGDNRVKFNGEWAIASMAPSKNVDDALLNMAKNGDQRHEAIRSMRNRGMTDAIPFLLENIKNNNDRAVSADALNEIATDKAYLDFAAIAVETEDDDLARRLVGISTKMARRSADIEGLIKGVAKLEAKANDKVKRALERTKNTLFLERVKYKKNMQDDEVQGDLVKLAEAVSSELTNKEQLISDLEKAKEREASGQFRKAVDKIKEILSK